MEHLRLLVSRNEPHLLKDIEKHLSTLPNLTQHVTENMKAIVELPVDACLLIVEKIMSQGHLDSVYQVLMIESFRSGSSALIRRLMMLDCKTRLANIFTKDGESVLDLAIASDSDLLPVPEVLSKNARSNEQENLEKVEILRKFLSEEEFVDLLLRQTPQGRTVLFRVKSLPMFQMLMDSVPENQRETLLTTLDTQDRSCLFFINPADVIDNLIKCLPDSKKRENFVKQRDCLGNTCLYGMHRTVEAVKVLIGYLSTENQLDMLLSRNNMGLTAFHNTTDEVARFLVSLVPFTSLYKLVLPKYVIDEKFPLHHMASYDDQDLLRLLDIVLPSLSIDHRKEIIYSKDEEDQTLLHLREWVDCTAILLRNLPYGDRLKFLTMCDGRGRTALHHSLFPEDTQQLIDSVASLEGDVAAFIMQTDHNGNTVLHDIEYFEQFEIYFKYLTPHEKEILIFKQNNSGDTVLHRAKCSDDVTALLNELSIAKKKEIIGTLNNSDQTCLHTAVLKMQSSDLFTDSVSKAILDYIPEEEIDAYILLKDSHGKAAYDYASPNHQQDMLEYISNETRSELLSLSEAQS